MQTEEASTACRDGPCCELTSKPACIRVLSCQPHIGGSDRQSNLLACRAVVIDSSTRAALLNPICCFGLSHTVTWVRALAGEVHDSRAAQGHDAGARVIQGSILMRHDALTRHVGIEQHMVGLLARPKGF